jgi:hypothetical protein
MTGLWEHDTRPKKFCLCVDEFGIKYFSTANTDHLLNSLGQHYKISVNWAGTDYCGLSIKWNYAKRYVDISMPGYIASTLERLQHPKPARPQPTCTTLMDKTSLRSKATIGTHR